MQIMNNNTHFFQFSSDRPRKGDLKKLEIIQAAIECISSTGFEKTTYEAIANKIGTRRAHIAYHFKNKSDIFKACIQYIYFEYQKILLSMIENVDNGNQKILLYAEAPFVWAQKYPMHLSTMLLFYYLSTIDKDYAQVNDEIRTEGKLRIANILKNEIDFEESKQNLDILALNIQNLISGAIIDAVTTKSNSIEQAKLNTKKHIEMLLTKRDK